MADITAIRRGLAALLKDALPGDQGNVSPWLDDNPLPPSLCVAGIDRDGYTATTFGPDPGVEIHFIVEAYLGAASSRGAQAFLDGLVGGTLAEALEGDQDASGALTKRLQDDGTVLTGQAAAADSVAVTGYLGQTRLASANGDVLIAQWRVTVEA